MLIAIYHLEAKVITRGIGRSAVAAAAYMSCSRIYNDYDGVTHDYTRKRGLIYEQVFLPEHAPKEWSDRSILWNAVEEAEKTKDSRLSRELVIALPVEFDLSVWEVMLKEYINRNFVNRGMCADLCIHDTDGHNPHAHIMLTVRPLNKDGSWQRKTEKEYLCVRGGEERGFTSAEYKVAQKDGWEKQYLYKIGKQKEYLPPSKAEGLERVNKYPKSTKYGRQNPISEAWNSEETLLEWRENFKTTSKNYKSKKRVDNPRDKQMVFLNTHPAIVSESSFENVQKIRENRRRPTATGKLSILSGKVFCADCGAKLHYCTAKGFNPSQDFFNCANYRSNMGTCSAHYIRNVTLYNMVFAHIKKMLRYVQQFEETFVRDQMHRMDKILAMSISKAKVDVVTLRRRDEDLNTLFKRLYEDMVAGRITAERFDLLSSEYEEEQKDLKMRIAELDDLIENGETQTKDLKMLLIKVRKYTDPEELTSEMLNDLVDKIIVHAPDKSSGHRKQKIEIYYNAVGILNLPTATEDDCIALHGRCKGKKKAG